MQDKSNIVSLCSGGGCCPDVVFSTEDGSVVLKDGDQTISMTKSAATLLAQALLERGYLDR